MERQRLKAAKKEEKAKAKAKAKEEAAEKETVGEGATGEPERPTGSD
jgi:hypothetical protein